MMPLEATKTTVIPIWPSTNVRSTQGDRWLFAVSDEYLQEYDQKRIETHGKVGRNLDRKRQLEKYNAYKEELRYWIEKEGFLIPNGYFAIWFYIPFPKSWTKKKQALMGGKPHLDTPDLDNLIKAATDGILPRRNRTKGEKGADDRRIHNYIPFKIWCPQGEEKIVINEYTESQILGLFPLPIPARYENVRKKRTAKTKEA